MIAVDSLRHVFACLSGELCNTRKIVGNFKGESMTLEEHMQVYESQGIARKEAMKLVAKDRGISKRDVYQALLS